MKLAYIPSQGRVETSRLDWTTCFSLPTVTPRAIDRQLDVASVPRRKALEASHGQETFRFETDHAQGQMDGHRHFTAVTLEVGSAELMSPHDSQFY